MRKDVECTFGALKRRFEFLDKPIRMHNIDSIGDAIRTCAALHNQLLRIDGLDQGWEDDEVESPREALTPEEEAPAPVSPVTPQRVLDDSQAFRIQSHSQLQDALISNFTYLRSLGPDTNKWPTRFGPVPYKRRS